MGGMSSPSHRTPFRKSLAGWEEVSLALELGVGGVLGHRETNFLMKGQEGPLPIYSCFCCKIRVGTEERKRITTWAEEVAQGKLDPSPNAHSTPNLPGWGRGTSGCGCWEKEDALRPSDS